MDRHARVMLLALFLLCLCLPALAQAAVVLEPVSFDSNRAFYPLEVRYLKLTVVNSGQEALKDFRVLVRAPAEMALPVEGEERNERAFSFLSLSPSESQEKVFEVKALRGSEKPVEVRAEYGSGLFGNFSSLYLNAAKQGLGVESKLGKGALNGGKTTSVSFEFTNGTAEKLSAIRAELFSRETIVVQGEAFELVSLGPGQSTGTESIEFSLGEERGPQLLILRIFFEDSNGMHVLEKTHSTEAGSTLLYALVLIAGVLALVLVHFFLKRSAGSELGGHDFGHSGAGRGHDSGGSKQGEGHGKWAHGDDRH